MARRGYPLTESTPDHVAANRTAWDAQAEWYAPAGERNWTAEPSWGLWGIPKAEVGFFPDLDGRDVLEDGCGTAYVSAWVARLGGHPVGLDNSPAQLATARRLQCEHDLRFPLIHGIAEHHWHGEEGRREPHAASGLQARQEPHRPGPREDRGSGTP